MNKYDIITNLAFFLLDNTGSVNGKFKGKLSAKEQRELFGVFLGKGTIEIDGMRETVRHIISVCFGHDFDVKFESKWKDILTTAERMKLK